MRSYIRDSREVLKRIDADVKRTQLQRKKHNDDAMEKLKEKSRFALEKIRKASIVMVEKMIKILKGSVEKDIQRISKIADKPEKTMANIVLLIAISKKMQASISLARTFQDKILAKLKEGQAIYESTHAKVANA